MSSIIDKLKFSAIIAKGIVLYGLYGPPCKSWDLKTWLVVYMFRSMSGSGSSLLEARDAVKISSATSVKNSKTEQVTIQDKFRQRSHDIVKEHLLKNYGEDLWYGSESHWSNTHPLEPEWIIPNHLNRSSKSNVILYIHGGAYVIGHYSKHRSELEILAQNTDSIVLGAHYRLAPDYSSPCQLEDVLAHILYLTSPVEESGIGLSFDQIIVSGDSAGGGLSSILNHFMRDANIGKLGGSLLYSPWIDLTSPHPSYTDCVDTDLLPALTNSTYGRDSAGNLLPGMFKDLHDTSDSEIQNRMLERGHHFAPEKYLNCPIVSPLCDNNFRDLPATFIISGEVESFRDESYLYHELINNSYSEEELSQFKIPPNTLHYYEEMFHIFSVTLPELPSSQIAAKRAINFIKQCFGQKSEDFEKIVEDNPINLGADKDDGNLTRPKQWRNLYLSTVNDHSLLPFDPNYRRVPIQTWKR